MRSVPIVMTVTRTSFLLSSSHVCTYVLLPWMPLLATEKGFVNVVVTRVNEPYVIGLAVRLVCRFAAQSMVADCPG